MVKAEQIPKECLVAYQRAFKAGGGPADGIAAALNAWPKTLWDYRREDGTRIILPLTTENTND